MSIQVEAKLFLKHLQPYYCRIKLIELVTNRFLNFWMFYGAAINKKFSLEVELNNENKFTPNQRSSCNNLQKDLG